MRTLCLCMIFVSLLTNSMFAATVGTWTGPTGSWSEASKWNPAAVPPTTAGGSDEIKITTNASICTVDDDRSGYVCRLSVASGPAGATLRIVPGGHLDMGDTRIGAAGATSAGGIGYAFQTGGTLAVSDLVLGRHGGDGGGEGYYTISDGLLTYRTGTNGRLFIGCGINGGSTEGTLTIVGSESEIVFRQLLVGASGSTFGKGTVEFVLDENGVTPIVVEASVTLDALGASSIAVLNVTLGESVSPPAEDIVLVNQTSAASISGQFDTINGQPAVEGAEVVLGDKIYTLTYQYAVGGGTANDIALVYVSGIDAKAYDPSPLDGAILPEVPIMLSWVNPEPNDLGETITCTVYLGTEPNRLTMAFVELDEGVSSVAVDQFGSLDYYETYYWIVDCYDSSQDVGLIPGFTWSFYINVNEPPTAYAGPDDVVWLGKYGVPGQVTVTLDGETSDDGRPEPTYTVKWTQVANNAPTVTIANDDQDTASVTFTARGVYEFRITADDGDKNASDTVKITVGNNACDASHLLPDAADYHPADVNQDCIVDIKDLVILAGNWLRCSDTLTDCGL